MRCFQLPVQGIYLRLKAHILATELLYELEVGMVGDWVDLRMHFKLFFHLCLGFLAVSILDGRIVRFWLRDPVKAGRPWGFINLLILKSLTGSRVRALVVTEQTGGTIRIDIILAAQTGLPTLNPLLNRVNTTTLTPVLLSLKRRPTPPGHHEVFPNSRRLARGHASLLQDINCLIAFLLQKLIGVIVETTLQIPHPLVILIVSILASFLGRKGAAVEIIVLEIDSLLLFLYHYSVLNKVSVNAALSTSAIVKRLRSEIGVFLVRLVVNSISVV